MRSLQLLSFTFFLLLAALAQAAEGPELRVEVLTFGSDHTWEATQSLMVRGENGRFVSEKLQPLLSAGNCGDLFQNFQTRPLDVMHDNGYISGELRTELQELHKNGIHPRQIVVVRSYSLLSENQAREEFGPQGVPPGRIIKRDHSPDGKEILMISRGSIYAVRGFVLEDRGARGFAVVPRAVPWEISDLPAHLARRFDRSKIPYLIEIGRAHAEKGPLPGNFRTVLHVLTTILENQTDAMGLARDQVVLSGHFLDTSQARYFMRMFPLRPLNSNLQLQLEENLTPTLANYMDLPLPSTEQDWSQYKDVVVIGSLTQAVKKYPAGQISESAVQIEARTRGVISAENALHFMRDFASTLEERFSYVGKDETVSRAPLILTDFGTPLLALKQRLLWRRYGWTGDEKAPEVQAVQQWLQKISLNLHPDAFLQSWVDRAIFFPVDLRDQRMRASRILSNLDPQMAREAPLKYVASVLLAVEDQLRAWFQNVSPANYSEILEIVNNELRSNGRPQLRDVDQARFLEFFPLTVATADGEVERQLQKLEGRPVRGSKIAADFKVGPIDIKNGGSIQFGMRMEDAALYEFRPETLAKLAAKYPELANQARNRLQRSLHMTWQRVLQSMYF